MNLYGFKQLNCFISTLELQYVSPCQKVHKTELSIESSGHAHVKVKYLSLTKFTQCQTVFHDLHTYMILFVDHKSDGT